MLGLSRALHEASHTFKNTHLLSVARICRWGGGGSPSICAEISWELSGSTNRYMLENIFLTCTGTLYDLVIVL